VFVDETGCNTNKSNDGREGVELFVLQKNINDAGAPTESMTDLHFTVLRFLFRTGEPVMCTVIFKSKQKVGKIPVSCKGLDIMFMMLMTIAK
jgi:hypothetical protein